MKGESKGQEEAREEVSKNRKQMAKNGPNRI